MQKLRDLWAALLAWLASQFMADEPTVTAPADEDPDEYHTMVDDDGQEAAVTKGPGYVDGHRR